MSTTATGPISPSLPRRRRLRPIDGREVRLRLRETPTGDWIDATPLTQEEVGKVGQAMAKAGRTTGAFRSKSLG